MPRWGTDPLRGLSFWEQSPPMGPSEDASTHPQNQGTSKPKIPWQKRRARHPRSRICLLKRCRRIFRPAHPLTRYCSEQRRDQARKWRQWKARHRYRQSAGAKQNRQDQSRRHRLRRKARKKRKACAVKGARVDPIASQTSSPVLATSLGKAIFRGSPAALCAMSTR